ncbi:hypothetical protein EDC01DRAFT_765319 [Geopyxis carbonaria]|nr:hypothetical protein EDC01DRAFT_765319 [Geopyxis carbonaria]
MTGLNHPCRFHSEQSPCDTLLTSLSDGFAGALDAPSPPPPVGQPLLDTQQQIFFDQFFEQMPSNMIPSVNPAHIFDPDMPKDTALWPESVPRGFPTSVHDMSSEALSAASNTSGFFGNHSVTSSPAVTDINPFDGSHQLLQPRQQDHTAINATPLLNFGTDTNFAPNGYHPPPPPVTLPDKDTEIRSKIYSALTKNESRITTAVNSPAEIKYEGSGDDMSPLREDESTSPQMGMGMVLGTKRRADDVDDFLPSKAARKPRPSAESALKHKKKSIAGPKRDNLSEAQKRENHIHSEQKRRNLIRQGFEELCALVPELKAGGYSKSAVLIHAANYLDDLKKGNAKLRLYLQQLEGARAY